MRASVNGTVTVYDSKSQAKNTGAWKGRLKRFFVDPYPEELAKNGANVI